jgi:recombination protein RecA
MSINGVGQGRENAKIFLKEHPDVAQKIEAEILEKNGIHKVPPVTGEDGKPSEPTPKEVTPSPKAPPSSNGRSSRRVRA